MTTQNVRGRRSATASTQGLRSAGTPAQERPRGDRRRRGPLGQVAAFAGASGVGQKAGIALAATGLALTVALPGTSAVVATSESGQSPSGLAQGTQPEVSAASSAKIDFSRAAVSTKADPDGKLKSLLSAQSVGSITRAASAGTLGAPLDQLIPSSPFGFRVSPITGGMGEFHRGQDYVAQCGTAVHAAASGRVTFAGWHPFGGGNRVVIDHGNGLETTYNHLSAFNVQVGQTVGRGEIVAMSGTTGASTGCHLHFEVMVNGEVVDPLGWL